MGYRLAADGTVDEVRKVLDGGSNGQFLAADGAHGAHWVPAPTPTIPDPRAEMWYQRNVDIGSSGFAYSIFLHGDEYRRVQVRYEFRDVTALWGHGNGGNSSAYMANRLKHEGSTGYVHAAPNDNSIFWGNTSQNRGTGVVDFDLTKISGTDHWMGSVRGFYTTGTGGWTAGGGDYYSIEGRIYLAHTHLAVGCFSGETGHYVLSGIGYR